MRFKFIFILGTSFMAVAAAQAQTVPSAQDTSSATDAPSDEIVVTAQKRSESVNKVGLSIQAFSGDTLKNAGITTTSDLTQIVSGFTFSRSNANTPIYTLRGVGFQTPNLSSTSPVGVYVDENAYAYPYMANGPTFDIERVEVLKGPQGTLYGRNTTGGLINFITAKPTETLGAGATVELGNYETYNFEAYANLPITDTLALRVSGRDENSDKGWQHSRTRDERLGKKDRAAARATLLWQPDADLKVSLGASYWQDKSDTIAPQAVGTDPSRPATVSPTLASAIHTDWKGNEADFDAPEAGKPSFRTNSYFYSINGRIDYKLTPEISIVSLTNYNRVRRRDFNDLDGTPTEVLAYGSNGHINSISQELRLTGDTARLHWVVGGFYAHDSIADDQLGYYGDSSTVRTLRAVAAGIPQTTYTPAQIANGFRNFVNVTRQKVRSVSVLGNVEWKVADRLSLIGGLRYTDDHTDFQGCSQDYNGNTIPIWNTAVAALTRSNTHVGVNQCLTYNASFTANTFSHQVLHENNVAGRAGVNFQVNPATLLYASVSRGFKSGAFPVLPANVETQFFPAKQEEVTAYEAGIKAGLFDRALQLNASGFYYDYRNKQLFGNILDSVFRVLSRIVNVPKSEVYGGELELSYRVSPALRVQGSASYVHAEITDFVGISKGGTVQDFAGDTFPNTPKWQLNGLASYDQPINGKLGLFATAGASYRSEATGAIGVDDQYRIKPYTLVNATLGLRTLNDRIRAGLYVRNLFNTYYWNTTDRAVDTIIRVPGMPRTLGLTVSYKY
ncbi:MAG: hypothetical protein JWO15_1871 [Sphingomonadales bacterium]|nr:hypothetical protein [Sphingomonadales bacterium]